ncbi:hypothetical protein PAPHI01_0662 [Pancytospora philotis]|nr:hypothetical protein PAPHI01_0662 [Pancytospora philotis]
MLSLALISFVLNTHHVRANNNYGDQMLANEYSKYNALAAQRNGCGDQNQPQSNQPMVGVFCPPNGGGQGSPQNNGGQQPSPQNNGGQGSPQQYNPQTSAPQLYNPYNNPQPSAPPQPQNQDPSGYSPQPQGNNNECTATSYLSCNRNNPLQNPQANNQGGAPPVYGGNNISQPDAPPMYDQCNTPQGQPQQGQPQQGQPQQGQPQQGQPQQGQPQNQCDPNSQPQQNNYGSPNNGGMALQQQAMGNNQAINASPIIAITTQLPSYDACAAQPSAYSAFPSAPPAYNAFIDNNKCAKAEAQPEIRSFQGVEFPVAANYFKHERKTCPEGSLVQNASACSPCAS